MIDTAGFKISGRDVFETPRYGYKMWKTSCQFEWIKLEQEEIQFVRELAKGSVVDDENVKLRDKVGVFSWYREKENRKDPEKFVAKDDNGLVGLFFHGGVSSLISSHSILRSKLTQRTRSARLSLIIQLTRNLNRP